VELVTLFPGLRSLFIRANFLDGAASPDAVSTLWDRPTDPSDEEWTFWKALAATSLSDTTVSAILEESKVALLTTCEEGRLSAIERLLVEHDSS
jgi:hypothetical protein